MRSMGRTASSVGMMEGMKGLGVLGCPGKEVLGSMVIGSMGYNPKYISKYFQIIHFNKVFNYKPSILGYPYYKWVISPILIHGIYWGEKTH